MRLTPAERVTLIVAAMGAAATIVSSAIGGGLLLIAEHRSSVPAKVDRPAVVGSACLALDERITAYMQKNPALTRAFASGAVHLPTMETIDETEACGDVGPFVRSLVRQLAKPPAARSPRSGP
jgi:hypothetical protein